MHIVICSALKCLANTNKDALLKLRLQEARMLDSAIQHYWKLVVERLYHIVPWLGGRMHPPYSPDMSPYDFGLFAKMKLLRGVRFRTRQAIIAAVEQSVRRLVQQDAVDGIRRLPAVWRRVLHVGEDYF